MKIECRKENLVKGLSIVSKTSDTRGSLPILSHILFETHNSRLRLAATNLEIGVASYIGAHVKEEGRCAIPAKVLSEFISAVNSEKIIIESVENGVVLKTDKGETRINSQPADEFPLIPVVEDQKEVRVSAHVFQDALSKVVFAASRDLTRPEISGVYMYFKDGQAYIVATDGHRLSEVSFVVLSGEFEEGVILPLRTVQELVRILSKQEGELVIRRDSSQVFFSYKEEGGALEVGLVSKLVEGVYPDYTQIIPKEFEATVQVDKRSLVNAIKGVSIFSGIETNEVVFIVSSDGVDISAESSEVGKSDITLKAKVSGPEQKISFNHRYLTEGLSGFDVSDVDMSFSTEGGPVVLKGVDSNEMRYVIMPLDTE